jgi:lysophospholipase L1-like esterase
MTRTIVYQILIVIALVLGLEATLRVVHTFKLDAAKEPAWYRYDAVLGWARRPNYSGDDDCNAKRTFDAVGLVAAESEKLANTEGSKRPRVIFLGDSNTYGACEQTSEAFPSVAARLVPGVDVINLGMNGYSSFQGFKALLKYGPLVRPDLIFISFNMNDRRFVTSPDLADSDAHFRRIARADRFQRLADASYFVWAAAQAGKWISGRSFGVSEMIGDTEASKVRLDKVVPRVPLAAYRDNLSKMVQWAKEHNAAVAFILLGDNPYQTLSLREGLKRLAERDVAGGVAALEEARDDMEDVWFASLARLQLSKLYAEAGRQQDAEAVLSMPKAITSLVGGYPVALESDYHDAMRSVAGEHGIAVVDAAAELNKTPEVFWDFCHFNEKGHEIVGGLAAAAIKAQLKGSS